MWMLNIWNVFNSVLEENQYIHPGLEMFYLTTHSTHFIYGYMAN